MKKRIEKIEQYDNRHIYKLGLIGSLNLDYKGHKTAIQAVSILSKKYNIELHFLGKGEKKEWEKFSKKEGVLDNVRFDGILPAGKPVYNWMDNMDIFLIPSLQEGLPRALVEAMSRGCPAIGVRTGGIPELLSEEFVANKKDFKNIAKMIEKMINSKEKMIEQAKLNFAKASTFKKEKLYEKRKAYYNSIINNL